MAGQAALPGFRNSPNDVRWYWRADSLPDQGEVGEREEAWISDLHCRTTTRRCDCRLKPRAQLKQ